MRKIKQVMVATIVGTVLGAAACAKGGDPAHERERFAAHGKGDLIIGAAWPWASRAELLYGQGLQLAVEQADMLRGKRLRSSRVLGALVGLLASPVWSSEPRRAAPSPLT